MFSLVAKIAKRLARYPLLILVVSLTFAALSVIPISNLRWELQLQDILSSREDDSASYRDIEKSFGGMGSLTVVIKSDDSLRNYKTAQGLSQALRRDTLVHFVEFETDIEFYKKHSLLYMSVNDLDSIKNRLESLKTKLILEQNPLFVDLGTGVSKDPANQDSAASQNYTANSDIIAGKADSSEKIAFNLDDIEEKYRKVLSKTHANENGTIRVIDIYPKNPLSDLAASRALLTNVKRFLGDKDVEVEFTGKVYDTIQTGRMILPEAKKAGVITAILILLLFILHFYRQPQLIVVAAIAAGLPVLYTLALSGIIFGRINLLTILLSLVLPGLACQNIIHVLNRYFIERNNKLGPQLSIESAILGIGPSTAASAAVFAALCLSVHPIPVAGVQELSILGAIGSILTWIVSTLLTASLLLLFQRKKAFTVNAFRFQREYNFKPLPYRTNKIFIAIVSIISFAGLVYGLYYMKFFYDFEKMEIQHKENQADILIKETGFPQYDPVIVMLPNQQAGEDLLENSEELKRRGMIPTIDRIYTLAQFTPRNQDAKKRKLTEIKEVFSDNILQNLDSANLHSVSRLNEALYRIDFDESDVPENLRNKFSDLHGNEGIFAFVFFNINPANGLECRRLNKDLQKFEGIAKGTYRISGTPILRALFLDEILSNLHKSIFASIFLIWFILLIYYNRLSRAIFTLLPTAFAMGWLVLALKVLCIELSAYNSFAFIILLAISVDGSLELWTAYYEKINGNAFHILQRKAFSVGTAQVASLIGTYGLLITSHPGLRSIGIVCVVGFFCISAAQFIIFPLIAGSLDNYRLKKQQKAQNS